MNKFIILLFVIWIVWKVIQSVIEEIRQRTQDRGSEEVDEPVLLDRPVLSPPRPARPSPPRGRVPDVSESAQPVSGRKENELERWYREALERKRQMVRTARTAPSPSTGEHTPPEPRRPRVRQQQPVLRRTEPRAERHREARVEQRRVAPAPPRETPPQRPPRVSREAPPPAPKPRQFRKRAGRPMRRQRAGAVFGGIGELGIGEVRKGIIMAELLGPPKALRDIDSHVI